MSLTVNIFSNGAIESKKLLNITSQSTEYEYGNALYEAIRDYVDCRVHAEVDVQNEFGCSVHKLLVIPKGGSIMVTDNAAGASPLSYSFKNPDKTLPEHYLVMVNPEHNNNKFYRMVDLGNNEWAAYYGRIGEKQGESVYSNHINKPYTYRHYMYGIKYNEKLSKGYQDVTQFHVPTGKTISKKEKMDYIGIADATVARLVKRLMDYANQTIKENYTVETVDVTPAMIEAAKKSIQQLYSAISADSSVEDFNNILLELMHIIPRRIDGNKDYGVKRMMASSKKDFHTILQREEDLLDVMEGQVKIQEAKPEEKEKQKTLLDAMGLEIYVARPEQKEQVLSHLNDSLKPKLKEVYRVINKKSQAKFDQYIKENGGKRKVKIKQLWHGSRNENWISILQNSLLLRPNATITGKMFGNGIYFAPSAAKSWGYTSARGTRWARGNQDTAFMALYATAYGKPYEVFSFSGAWSGYNYDRLQREHPGCSCVHAKKDRGMLHEDEIIFYREDQMTINYICEFSG